MLELTDWFTRTSFPAEPWLMVGKGPTFERRTRFDLSRYNVVGLNHVVTEMAVDVAHAIDIDVVADCAEALERNSRWLLMPRYPHVRSSRGVRRLEDWFDEIPTLRRLDEQGRLVWYNLVTDPIIAGSPVIAGGTFSSQAVLAILGRMGVRCVRTLGIDGGRSYASTFAHMEESTLLQNGEPTFDVQFTRLREIAEEFQIDLAPLVEPLRVFVGCERSQVVAYRVLEYSIRKSASIPVDVVPMVDLPHPRPRHQKNWPRTSFSFARFMIPQLCEYKGRAVYMDADMLVTGDVAELAELPFDGHTVLCSAATSTDRWAGFDTENFGARTAVMLLDCSRLDWDIGSIVEGLDRGHYTYEQLMGELCVVDRADVADTIPAEWNDLERYEPGVTRLVHFTVVPTQPWRSDDNELGDLWMEWYREAVRAGAVPPEEVEELADEGLVKPALRAALRSAPSRRSVLTRASLDAVDARREISRLEAELAAMRSSSSWRIGNLVVRIARTPLRVLHRLRRSSPAARAS